MTILKHVTIYSYLAGINNIKSRWRSNLLLLQPVHNKSKCTVQLLWRGERKRKYHHSKLKQCYHWDCTFDIS